MSKYGYCENCGSVMQTATICTYCDEEAMETLIESWESDNNSYPDWSVD